MASPDRVLMLPEGRESAWLDGEGKVSVIMPRHKRTINMAGEQVEVEVPRLLVRVNDDGTFLLCGAEKPYRSISNVWEDGRICYGKNPTPQDPWESWNFFWNGQFNTDLNKYSFHGPQDCPEVPCQDHEDGECPPQHRCADGACRCDPPDCECLPKHVHEHGYKTSACDCCEGRCDHTVETCTCDAGEWRCPCETNDCSCESGAPCNPADEDACGCGMLAKWRDRVKAEPVHDYDGPGPSEDSLFVFPPEAAGWTQSGSVVNAAGLEIAKVQSNQSLEGYKFKVGDRVRFLPRGSLPLPDWWTDNHHDHAGSVVSVRALRPGKFYVLHAGLKVPEDWLEGEFENWAFAVGQRAVPLTGRHAGRALYVNTCHMGIDQNRFYYLNGLRDALPADQVRAPTPDDPLDLAPMQYKFAIGDWVKMKPGAEAIRESWFHRIGTPHKVIRQTAVREDPAYTLEGIAPTVPEDCLEPSEPRAVYGIQNGSIVRVLPRPDPCPIWWTKVEPGTEFHTYYTPGTDSYGIRCYEYVGNAVPESCLEVVSGPAPVNEGPTVTRPTCMVQTCTQLGCNPIKYANPNYPAPAYNPRPAILRVGATVRVKNVKGVSPEHLAAAVGKVDTIRSFSSDGMQIWLDNVEWCLNPDDLEVLA